MDAFTETHMARGRAAEQRRRLIAEHAVTCWPPKDWGLNTVCFTCEKKRLERLMKIYDVPNDKWFCSEECENARPDRE